MAPIADAMPALERKLEFSPIENDNPSKLTKEQIQHFNEKGYIFPLDVFSEDEIVAHREYFDQLMAKVMKAGWNSYSINGWHARCPGIYDLVREPRILDYVQDVLGENLIGWATHYFCKMPGDTKRVSWHQDASYWPLTPSKTVTLWLAIDDTDVENGAMQFIPRSHLHGQIAFERSTAEEENVLNQTVHGPEQYGDAPVSIELKAGQISLHSDLLLHGSAPNSSDRRRCGLTLRFVPPEVRAYRGWSKGAIIARGADASGHWIHSPRPSEDTIPAKT
ncbi:MAG: phytanoyl-CoA dioxygenase family protein [Candidatus Poribacteria bacterium]|nr:phytanoyl-CoA dioxygenase family protein [Candidatus Poribacteria bacterium]